MRQARDRPRVSNRSCDRAPAVRSRSPSDSAIAARSVPELRGSAVRVSGVIAEMSRLTLSTPSWPSTLRASAGFSVSSVRRLFWSCTRLTRLVSGARPSPACSCRAPCRSATWRGATRFVSGQQHYNEDRPIRARATGPGKAIQGRTATRNKCRAVLNQTVVLKNRQVSTQSGGEPPSGCF